MLGARFPGRLVGGARSPSHRSQGTGAQFWDEWGGKVGVDGHSHYSVSYEMTGAAETLSVCILPRP
jgi:hypothetical protein